MALFTEFSRGSGGYFLPFSHNQFVNQYGKGKNKGANGEDVHPQGELPCGDFPFGTVCGPLRGRIAAGRAAVFERAFVGGKTALGAKYRREKPAAARAGIRVPPDFRTAIVAKKTRFFTHWAIPKLEPWQHAGVRSGCLFRGFGRRNMFFALGPLVFAGHPFCGG